MADIMARERVQDILISSIFSMFLGLIGALTGYALTQVFLEDASPDFLKLLLVIYLVGFFGTALLLWTYAKRLGRPPAREGPDRVGEVELTDAGKTWIQGNYPQGIVWNLNLEEPFKLHRLAAEFVEISNRGVHYRIPFEDGGEPTIRKVYE